MMAVQASSLWKKPVRRTLVFVVVLASSTSCFAADTESELAEMDAAAATLKSIRSWVNNDPEAAIEAFQNYSGVRAYLDRKYREYCGAPLAESTTLVLRPAANRFGDRMKAIETGVREWEEFIPKYHASQPKQIATELKRQRNAVARYRKAKSPRPSSFAYIPKTVWKTKDKLDVLTASGADTKRLQAEQKEVQSLVLDLLGSLDAEVIAEKNGFVRDAYSQNDRQMIEDFVRKSWAAQYPDRDVERIVMPKSSWATTYAARADKDSGQISPYEVERVTVYVATKKTDSILTLHPFRLMREHYRINGKRIGRVGPQPPQQTPTNEFSFDVLAKNIR